MLLTAGVIGPLTGMVIGKCAGGMADIRIEMVVVLITLQGVRSVS